MKKLVILAILAAPFFGMAQDKKVSAAPAKEESFKADADKQKPDSKLSITNPESIFIELVVAENNNGVSIRVDLGREGFSNVQDKQLQESMTELRVIQFTNIPDAMTYLSQLGFKFVTNYEVRRMDKVDTHFIFERRLSRKAGPDNVSRPSEVTGSKRPDAPQKPTPAPAPKGKK